MIDWARHAMERPRIFVLANPGTGLRQYLASLPYAAGASLSVLPASRDVVYQIAEAIYNPGHPTDASSPIRHRLILAEGAFAGQRITLADGRAEGNNVSSAIGLVFLVDPFAPHDRNLFIADILRRVTQTFDRWRSEGGVAVPSDSEPWPVSIVATKRDALPEGHPLDRATPALDDLVGNHITELLRAFPVRVATASVSAWGDGAGPRHAGTRYAPVNVMEPIGEIVRAYAARRMAA